MGEKGGGPALGGQEIEARLAALEARVAGLTAEVLALRAAAAPAAQGSAVGPASADPPPANIPPPPATPSFQRPMSGPPPLAAGWARYAPNAPLAPPPAPGPA